MADMKISDLPVAPNVNDAQQFEVNDGGNSRRVTFQQLREKIKAEFGKPIYPAIIPASWDDLPTTYPGTGVIPVLVRKSTDGDNQGPPGYAGHYYYVQQFIYNSTRVTQIAFPYTGAPLAVRYRHQEGTWSAWKTIAYGDHNHDSAYAPKTHMHGVADFIGMGSIGQLVYFADSVTQARSVIGAGTSNLEIGTTATTAKAGDWIPNINTETTGQLPYSRLTGVPSTGPHLPAAFAVGSYVLADTSGGTAVSVGVTVSGSSLHTKRWKLTLSGNDVEGSGYVVSLADGNTVSGTWRNMGAGVAGPSAGARHLAFFMRIA